MQMERQRIQDVRTYLRTKRDQKRANNWIDKKIREEWVLKHPKIFRTSDPKTDTPTEPVNFTWPQELPDQEALAARTKAKYESNNKNNPITRSIDTYGTESSALLLPPAISKRVGSRIGNLLSRNSDANHNYLTIEGLSQAYTLQELARLRWVPGSEYLLYAKNVGEQARYILEDMIRNARLIIEQRREQT